MTFKALLAASAIGAALTFSISPSASAGPNPYIGDIQIFAGNFCPRSWAEANGQLLPIAQNTALFSLYGTTFGGDGRTTFGLPDLRGRTMVGEGVGPGLPNESLGQRGGAEQTTIGIANYPSHSHRAGIQTHRTDADSTRAKRNAFAPTSEANTYHSGDAPDRKFMNLNSIVADPAGGGQPVNNMQPSLGITHCVALQGVFPSRS